MLAKSTSGGESRPSGASRSRPKQVAAPPEAYPAWIIPLRSGDREHSRSKTPLRGWSQQEGCASLEPMSTPTLAALLLLSACAWIAATASASTAGSV